MDDSPRRSSRRFASRLGRRSRSGAQLPRRWVTQRGRLRTTRRRPGISAAARVRRMNLLACVLLLAAAPGADDAPFEAFAQKYVQELLDRKPETATRLGEHRNDARLNDYSAQGVERDLAAAKGGLAKLERIESQKLSAEDAVDYRILTNRLEAAVSELQTIIE